MKKLLSIVTLLGALSGAASAAPYVLPSPQPGALTPYDWQPVYSIEGIYAIAQDDDMPDTYGVRGSFSLYNSGANSIRHQFSINLGFETGDDTVKILEQDVDVDINKIPLTLGYDINIELFNKTFLYLGGKAGYAWADVDVTAGGVRFSDTTGGFTFSVGGGLKVQCSDAIYVKVGYEFGRTYLDLEDKGISRDVNFGQHTISVGVGCQF